MIVLAIAMGVNWLNSTTYLYIAPICQGVCKSVCGFFVSGSVIGVNTYPKNPQNYINYAKVQKNTRLGSLIK
jgi:hypothetical protein